MGQAPKFSTKLYLAKNVNAAKGKLHKLGTSKADVQWDQTPDIQTAKMLHLQCMMTHIVGTPLQQEMTLYNNQGMTLHTNKSESQDCYVGNMVKDAGAGAEDWMIKTPELTCFSIGVTGHAMGGFWKKGEAFFFDPNEGVYKFGSINDLAEGVPDFVYDNYIKGKDSQDLYLYKVTVGQS
jgi:hypothetical protein